MLQGENTHGEPLVLYPSLFMLEPPVSCLPRVRFLLGGRHGDFKFLPPSSYAPCCEALLPREKMRVEPVKEYKRDEEGVRDLLGTTQLLSQASFIPTPVETSQVALSTPHSPHWNTALPPHQGASASRLCMSSRTQCLVQGVAVLSVILVLGGHALPPGEGPRQAG